MRREFLLFVMRMAELGRNRAKKNSSVTGNRRRYVGGVLASQDTRTAETYSICVDNVGYYPLPNPVVITHVRKGNIKPLNGDFTSGAFRTVFENCPSTWHESTPISHVDLGLPSAAADATKAMARTNPNRPAVDMPVLYAELRELPSLIRSSGRTLLDDLPGGNPLPGFNPASNNLAWQFGWAPLISDLGKLLDFQNVVRRKAVEFQKLYEKGGLRKRIYLGSYCKTGYAPNVTIQSVYVVLRCNITRQTIGERWAVVRWRPIAPIVKWDPKSHRATRKIQRLLSDRSVVLGLGAGLSTIWESIPWTWLIDWFINVGDVLHANRGGVPLYMSRCSVMTHQTTRYDLTRIDSIPISGGGGNAVYETKDRSIHHSPSLSASIPFLSGRQLGILASLAVLRRPRFTRAY